MILAIVWANNHDLVGQDVVWYKKQWERGTVLENGKAKLIWDFEFYLRKTTTARRPDLILKDKEENVFGYETWLARSNTAWKRKGRRS